LALQYAAFTAANLLKSPLRYELEQRASVDCVHVVELYLAMVLVQSGACDVSWQPGSVDAVTVEHRGEQSPANGGTIGQQSGMSTMRASEVLGVKHTCASKRLWQLA
jgi:hypothetical protein